MEQIGKIAKKWDITGKRFGRVEVIGYAGNDPRNNTRWLCRCDCGIEKIIRRVHLVDGTSTSCGCYQKEINGSWSRTHGMTNAPTHRSWNAMLGRCNRPHNASYERYGGRGIQVCDRWKTFENFFADMSEKPKGCVIDRKDNDGNYEPSNCKWSTFAESSRNRKATKLTVDKVREIKRTYHGRGSNLIQTAARYGVTVGTICNIMSGKTWRDVTA